jgi:hypothetical protein
LKNIQSNGQTSKATAADLAAGVTPRRREAQIRAKIRNIEERRIANEAKRPSSKESDYKIRLDLAEMSPQNIAL